MRHRRNKPFSLILFAAVMILLPQSLSAQARTDRTAPTAAQNIDFFIGSPDKVVPRTLFGALEVRDILTRNTGNPLRPAKKGAVLSGLNSVSRATLAPRRSTKPSSLSGVQDVLYIASGWGTIRSGKGTFSIRQGFGIIVPPKVEFTLSNEGDNPLVLYIIEEPLPDGFVPKETLVVKNDFDLPVSTDLRRADSDGWLLTEGDGLAALDGMDPVVFVPRSYISPHAHLPGDEEIWIALDEITVLLGDKKFVIPEGSAYRVPPDGRTGHVNLNTTNQDKRLLWLVLTSGTPVESAPEPQKKVDPRKLI
jgi:mannose-6-phosphate isomerase-like protein (cupin superfamily)